MMSVVCSDPERPGNRGLGISFGRDLLAKDIERDVKRCAGASESFMAVLREH